MGQKAPNPGPRYKENSKKPYIFLRFFFLDYRKRCCCEGKPVTPPPHSNQRAQHRAAASLRRRSTQHHPGTPKPSSLNAATGNNIALNGATTRTHRSGRQHATTFPPATTNGKNRRIRTDDQQKITKIRKQLERNFSNFFFFSKNFIAEYICTVYFSKNFKYN